MEFEGCVAVAAGRPTTVKKPKPKTRILHVFPPEIIKTDAANFRELVQRLTGKPVTRASSNRRKKKKEDEAGCVGLEGEVAPSCEQVGLWRGTQELGSGGGAKVELEEKDSGGFSWEFGEIESFLHELSDVSWLPSCTSPANNDSGGFSWEFGEIESFLHELSDVSWLPSCTSPANNS